MKIAFFGGTFNPLHLGHCAVGDALVEEARYDTVLFVVANEPSHKKLPPSSPDASSRFRMVDSFCKMDACMEKKNRFIAEDAEIKRGGVSYTYDTLLYLCEKWGDKLDGKIGLVLGEEEIRQFYKWYMASNILEMCDIISVRRRSAAQKAYSKASNIPINGFVSDFSYHESEEEKSINLVKSSFSLQNPYIDISSSMLRERIAEGLSFRYLLPPNVYEDIVRNGYYGYREHF